MKKHQLTAMLGIGMVVMASVASALVYTEDFNGADPGTWETYGTPGSTDYCVWKPTGGVGDSGYMEAYRAVNYYSGIRPAAGEVGYRDYVADFGTRFLISYDAKFISGQNGGMSFQISGGDDPSHYAYWRKDIYTVADGGAPTDWTKVNVLVDTTWTKAEAEAHGWVETTAHNGGGTWGGVWTDGAGVVRTYSTNFFSQASDRVRGPNNYTAIDNFRIVVPEPTSLGLLILGALVLTRKRR